MGVEIKSLEAGSYDAIVNDIVNSVIDNTIMHWEHLNLTLVDESWIQMILRDSHGLDLQCYNLNAFPKNTSDLKKLLINV
jgi:hypothetical protein